MENTATCLYALQVVVPVEEKKLQRKHNHVISIKDKIKMFEAAETVCLQQCLNFALTLVDQQAQSQK
jgi:hypothetical protein